MGNIIMYFWKIHLKIYPYMTLMPYTLYPILLVYAPPYRHENILLLFALKRTSTELYLEIWAYDKMDMVLDLI